MALKISYESKDKEGKDTVRVEEKFLNLTLKKLLGDKTVTKIIIEK